MHIRVLLEHRHFLAVSKPAGLISQSEASGSVSARLRVERPDLFVANYKPPFHEPRSVHRLDRSVTGVLLCEPTATLFPFLRGTSLTGSRYICPWHTHAVCSIRPQARPQGVPRARART